MLLNNSDNGRKNATLSKLLSTLVGIVSEMFLKFYYWCLITGKSTPILVSTCLLWNNIVRLQLLKKRPQLSDLGKEVWSSNVGKSKFARNDRSHNLSPFFPTKHSGKPWGKSPSYLSPNSGCPQHSVGVGWPLLEAIVDLSRVLWCPLMSNNLLFFSEASELLCRHWGKR